jgi:hypothetical protein
MSVHRRVTELIGANRVVILSLEVIRDGSRRGLKCRLIQVRFARAGRYADAVGQSRKSARIPGEPSLYRYL